MKTSLELINEFEKTFQVEKWMVNDIHIWPAIRIPLMTAWEQSLYYKNTNIHNKKKGLYSRVFDELNQLLLAICSYKKSGAGIYEVGVWGLDVERVMIQDKYYSPYGDALRDLEFKNKLLCLDLTIRERRKSHYPSADITLGYFINRYAAKIYSIFKGGEDVKAPLEESREWCKDRGLSITGLTSNNLVYQYTLLNFVKNYFKRIIQKNQMQICFKVSWYDTIGMALSWASKDMKIPCFDLQHGIAGSTQSRAYSSWSRVPKSGYKLMPDGFWSWSENDAKEIESWSSGAVNPVKVFVGGNVWNRVWKEGKLSIKPWCKNVFESNNINILYTLQGEGVSELLVDLIKNSPKEWNWMLRCHPMRMDSISDINQKIKSINTKAEVDVINATKEFLPNILMNTDIHISGWSAVVFDAKDFGIKSILCHPSSKILFKDMLSRNEVVYMDNTSQIINEIQENIENYKQKVKRIKYPSFNKFLESHSV